jgi:hypothetical protein
MMGTKREDSKISGSSQKQIQKNSTAKRGQKKGDSTTLLKISEPPLKGRMKESRVREKGKKNNNPRAIAKMREIIIRPEKRARNHRSLKQTTERGGSRPQVKYRMRSNRRERETNKEANEEVGGRRRRRRKASEL